MGNKNSSGSEPSLSNFTPREDDDILSSVALPNRGNMFDNFNPPPSFHKRSATSKRINEITMTVFLPSSLPTS